MKPERIVVYPGTFDPITSGHLDLIKRAAPLVDYLIVGVSQNVYKACLFSPEERFFLVKESIESIQSDFPTTKIETRPFEGLLVNFAKKVGAQAVIRGLRAVSDFEYEFQMAAMNGRISEDLETLFLMASDDVQFISSRFVKEIGRLGGDIRSFVPSHVYTALQKKFSDMPE